jgi:hypothetical protein
MPSQQTSRQGRGSTAPPQPTASPGDAPGGAVPRDLDEAALAEAQSEGYIGPGTVAPATAGAAEPMLDPPGTPGASRVADAGAFANVRVLALFSSAHPNNGHAFLEGVGWRRFATDSTSAHLNLGALSAAARAQGTATPVRHEGDGKIHEIYLW